MEHLYGSPGKGHDSLCSITRSLCVAEWYLHTGVGSRVLDKTDAGFLQGPEGIHRVRIREITSRD